MIRVLNPETLSRLSEIADNLVDGDQPIVAAKDTEYMLGLIHGLEAGLAAFRDAPTGAREPEE